MIIRQVPKFFTLRGHFFTGAFRSRVSGREDGDLLDGFLPARTECDDMPVRQRGLHAVSMHGVQKSGQLIALRILWLVHVELIRSLFLFLA